MLNDLIPQSMSNVLVNLEFLALIGPKMKPCINDMSIVDSGTIYSSIKRFMKGETGNNVVLFVNQTLNDTSNAIRDDKKRRFTTIIIETLKRAQTGIKNLKDTYSDRPEIVSQLRVSLANVKLIIDRYQIIDPTPLPTDTKSISSEINITKNYEECNSIINDENLINQKKNNSTKIILTQPDSDSDD